MTLRSSAGCPPRHTIAGAILNRKLRSLVSILAIICVLFPNASALTVVSLTKGTPYPIRAPGVSFPAGLYAAFVGEDGNVYLRHLESGAEIQISYDAGDERYFHLSFSDDGRFIASQFGGKDTGELVLFDLEHGMREVVADDLSSKVDVKRYDWGPEQDDILYAPGHFGAEGELVGDGLVIVNITTGDRQVFLEDEEAFLVNPIINPLRDLVACERLFYTEGTRPFIVFLSNGTVHEDILPDFPDASDLDWLWSREILFGEAGKFPKPASGIVDYLPFAHEFGPYSPVSGRIDPPDPQSALAYPVVSHRDFFVFTLWTRSAAEGMELAGLCRAWQTGHMWTPGMPGYEWSFDYIPDLFPLSFATASGYQWDTPTPPRWLLCTAPEGCAVVNCDTWEVAYSLPMAHSGALHAYGAPLVIASKAAVYIPITLLGSSPPVDAPFTNSMRDRMSTIPQILLPACVH